MKQQKGVTEFFYVVIAASVLLMASLALVFAFQQDSTENDQNSTDFSGTLQDQNLNEVEWPETRYCAYWTVNETTEEGYCVEWFEDRQSMKEHLLHDKDFPSDQIQKKSGPLVLEEESELGESEEVVVG